MTAPNLFDGKTYDPDRDESRLAGQLLRVYELMRDGAWRTLADIAEQAQGSQASVSARLRDLRKKRFGAHRVERKSLGGGLFTYQLLANVAAEERR